MPCTDGRDNCYDNPETQRRLDLVTRLLCTVCAEHEPTDPEAKAWWTKHQREDKQRKAAEANAKLKHELKGVLRQTLNAVRDGDMELAARLGEQRRNLDAALEEIAKL